MVSVLTTHTHKKESGVSKRGQEVEIMSYYYHELMHIDFPRQTLGSEKVAEVECHLAGVCLPPYEVYKKTARGGQLAWGASVGLGGSVPQCAENSSACVCYSHNY